VKPRALGIAAAAAALLLPGGLQAQDLTAAGWRQLAQGDVDAGHRLLAEDHPGAAPEANDAAFRRRLAEAHAEARRRAAEVVSFEGYAATLRGFAAAMADKHIAADLLVVPEQMNWAGLVVARRGNDWIVAREEEAVDESPLGGSRLVSCDGVGAEAFAERRLGGFRAIWSIPAQQIEAAPYLFIDDGNPFLTRPAACIFERGGQRREVALRWRSTEWSRLEPRLRAAARRGAAGFGVRRSGAGYWIALQSLGEDAAPVVEAVRAQAADMRRAPWVVLDMRGNGGGNSAYGSFILDALLGRAASRGEQVVGCNPVWRASPRNIAVLRSIADRPNDQLGAGATVYWRAQHRRAVEAAAAGRALSGPPACGATAAAEAGEGPRRRPRGSLFSGRLIVLTDHVCFSSCVLVTSAFRRLGALHVGEATDAMTRYFEVRSDELPSGLAAFSTLQALSPSSPAQIGPFVPDRLYDGNIADTAALEAWVAGLAQSGDIE
jgi:hypothetical protein